MEGSNRKVCENDTDPITMEEFSTMPLEEIIFLGRYCFHLPSIFDWVYNRGKNTNPYTNLEFTLEEKATLKDVALETYPLKIKVLSMTRVEAEIPTTSLTSVKRLFINVLQRLGFRPDDSLYKALTITAEKNVKLMIKIGEQSRNLAFYLNRDENQQLKDIGAQGELAIFKVILSTPPDHKVYLESMRPLYIRMGYPTQNLDYFIANIDRVIRDANRGVLRENALREHYRPAREARIAQLPEPGPNEIRINVTINSRVGRAYGTIPLNVSLNSQLIGVEIMLREEVGAELVLPNNPFGFIYAGIIYDEYTEVGNLPGIENGSTIFITYM